MNDILFFAGLALVLGAAAAWMQALRESRARRLQRVRVLARLSEITARSYRGDSALGVSAARRRGVDELQIDDYAAFAEGGRPERFEQQVGRG